LSEFFNYAQRFCITKVATTARFGQPKSRLRDVGSSEAA